MFIFDESDNERKTVYLCLPAVLKVLGNDGGGQGDEAAEDPDQADRQEDPYPRGLWL